MDAGQQPRLELGLHQRTADTEVGKPALPHREPMRDYSDRKINLHALAPSMFHQTIISQADGTPHRTNTEFDWDNSYKRRALLCLHRGAPGRNYPEALGRNYRRVG